MFLFLLYINDYIIDNAHLLQTFGATTIMPTTHKHNTGNHHHGTHPHKTHPTREPIETDSINFRYDPQAVSNYIEILLDMVQ